MELVRTKQGMFRGAVKDGYTVFYGIPYGEAPVGDARFLEPAQALPFQGERDCTHPSVRPWMADPKEDSAVAKEFYFHRDYWLPRDEDSLQLHIWTPARQPGEKLPVAVWIHGGAFQKGYGTEVETDGEGFCARDVILVSIEYRMGIFGFFCHPWLSEEPFGGKGNLGLLDQIEALKWVRDNIEAFGGDPGRVTIIGQSAGAISVQILASSPLARGLFHGAVMQSGGGYQSPVSVVREMGEAWKLGEEFTEYAGIHSLEELRQMPAERLCQMADEFQARTCRSMAFAPVIDGYVLTYSLDGIIEGSGHGDIPYLMGSNLDDLYTEELAAALERFAQKNRRLHKPPVYLYRFEQVPPASQEGMYAGSYHSAELWYVFETCRRGSRPYGREDLALSKEMADCWCSFVKDGNPDPDGKLGWSFYRSRDDIYRFYGGRTNEGN